MQSSVKFDFGKLMAGGALAAIVMNIIDFLSNNFVLANDWELVARLRNIDQAAMSSGAATFKYIAIDVALGFLVVLVYALIRTRLGKGGATASIAAFLVFLPQALYMASLAGAFFTWDIFVRSAAMLLVSTLAGGLCGAWIYTEPTDDVD